MTVGGEKVKYIEISRPDLLFSPAETPVGVRGLVDTMTSVKCSVKNCSSVNIGHSVIDGFSTRSSLQVNMVLVEGSAELTVKVRCERIVPIRGSQDLYKK